MNLERRKPFLSMPVISCVFFPSKYEYELLKQLLRNVEQNLIRRKCDHSHTHSDSDLPVARGYDRLEKTNTTNDIEL